MCQLYYGDSMRKWSGKPRLIRNDGVRYWHLADDSTAPAFVRFQTRADKAATYLKSVIADL